MGFKNFIKDAIEEEKNKTPEQKQKEVEEKEIKKLNQIYDRYEDYLLEGEKILFHTANLKGSYLFLENRILFHDDRLRKGTKQEYDTVPYKNIKRFIIEKAGLADMDTDIKLFLGGSEIESLTLKVPINSTKEIDKIILSKII